MTSIGVITELEDLRIYLQERVREYDSTIDTALGSTFDNTVIQPLINRIGPDPYTTGIVDFIHGRLRGEFTSEELVLQDGEPIDDLVIRPNRVLIEAFRRQIRLIALNQSLANPELLNEKEADNLGANFFARRRLGGFSVGTARLYFTAPQFALVNPSNALLTGSGLQYFPIETQAIQADRMVFNTEDNLFYFDIVVRSEQQGSQYDIPANNLTSVEGVPAVVKVTNKRKFEGGGDKEETIAFIERVENSLTEKSLVTTRGVNARLLDTFENIQLIQVIGFGDPEMNRDIITGATDSPTAYADALVTAVSSTQIDLTTPTSSIVDYAGNGSFKDTFPAVNVEVGDEVLSVNTSTAAVDRYTITEVLSQSIYVDPPIVGAISAVVGLSRPQGGITISDIPGGILGPDPTIEINSGEVHIGGAYDVFVRAGDPQDRDITLEGVLDAEPLRFGLDLESYGSEADQVAHVTQSIDNVASIPNTDRFGGAIADADLLEVVIQALDDSATEFNPWVPTEDDVGRYIQIREPSPSLHHGTYLITEFIGEEYYSGERCVRIKIDQADEERSGADAEWLAAGPEENTLTLKVRIAEKISIKNRVRDLDQSTVVVAANNPAGRPAILGGVDFGSIGVEIGDSVVIESGNDAGIYSIRRVLDWLATGDALILDRDLTDTVVTTGANTGLRYRIADDLNVDLVSPQVPKIPLGGIFDGDDLSSIAGSNVVSTTGTTNFLLAGAEEGDTLEILDGTNQGQYTISSVTGTTAELDRAVLSTLSNQDFEVYRAFTGITRPMVRVNEIELLDSNSQPTGITIPYGDAIDARILGTLSNRAQGLVVESFIGELQDNGAGYIDLEDTDINFDLEGVEAGYRLNILNGDSVGSYTIIGTGTDPAIGLTANVIRVAAAADGGTAFLGADTDVHYSIGLPSAGIVRLFFLEPTSAEITTGLAGGRIQYSEGGVTEKVFQFSPVTGFNIVPAPGDPDDDARDLRVVRSYLESITAQSANGTTTVGTGIYTHTDTFITDGVQVGDTLRLSNGTGGGDDGDYIILSIDTETQVTVDATFGGDTTIDHAALRYRTVVELTDSNRPGVYELEIQEGDTVEVNEPIPFRLPSTGAPLTGQTFDEAGVFGATAPLQTRAGDNLVSVPANSLVDFQEMDSSFPLIGQTLYIESGPDAGAYVIEEVVSDKELRLDAVMTGTTDSFEARDVNGRSGLALTVSGSNTKMQDTDDSGQVALLADGQYVTIFESTRSDIDGTHQITDSVPGTPNTVEIDLSTTNHAVDLDTFSIGPFSWIATDTNNPGYAFHIYKSVATEFEVLEVATKAGFNSVAWSDSVRADITAPDQLLDKSGLMVAAGAQKGDIVEVLNGGVLQGVYHIESQAGANVVIHDEVPFPIDMDDVAVRYWGGMVGSRRMLTLGPKDSSTGRVTEGDLIPYRVIRTAIQRLSSTEMADNFDGTLYYVDVEIESEGSGDDLNLSEGSRMEVTSGLRVDGYTYSVDNENLSYSTFEEVSLNFDRRFLPVGNSDSPENLTEVSGRNLKVSYGTSSTTRLVNDMLRGDPDRVVNANPIARHFLPSFVYTSLQYQGGITEQNMGPQLEELVNVMGAEDELRVSDLEGVLVKNGAESIEHPIEIVTVTHDLGRQLVVNRSDNKVGGTNAVPFNGTGRLSAFFTEYEETLLLVRES